VMARLAPTSNRNIDAPEGYANIEIEIEDNGGAAGAPRGPILRIASRLYHLAHP
jgi:hypothetical protein